MIFTAKSNHETPYMYFPVPIRATSLEQLIVLVVNKQGQSSMKMSIFIDILPFLIITKLSLIRMFPCNK